jgi:hypothetical protein
MVASIDFLIVEHRLEVVAELPASSGDENPHPYWGMARLGRPR